MSTISFPHAQQNQVASSYAQNVAHAFRSLLAALFAIKPQLTSTSALTPRAAVREQRAVFEMARQYEQFSPNLAAELRFIARG